MSERGTGRTARQLANLPAGAIFIVPFPPMAEHCRRLLAEADRDPRELTFVYMHGLDRLRGLPRKTVLDIDHAVFDFAPPEVRDELRIYRHRFALPPVAQSTTLGQTQ